jgi:hypothetical protein
MSAIDGASGGQSSFEISLQLAGALAKKGQNQQRAEGNIANQLIQSAANLGDSYNPNGSISVRA